MNHIELFAGCGGLSLGLESAGFKLLIANELSPMASETFAYNHQGVDLAAGQAPSRIYWVSSKYPRDNLRARLRENPNDAVGLTGTHISDIQGNTHDSLDLMRSLLVGSIVDINSLLENHDWFHNLIRSGLGEGAVDLVSGGPPCQSFSLAGLRDHSHHRNQLPWEFARFIGYANPKIAILENVTGILRAFKLEGKSYYAWFEVAKAFAKVGYVPICLHINAKYVGAAQNRPRFILLAFREDVCKKLRNNSKDELLSKALAVSAEFYNLIKGGTNPEFGCLPYYDIEKDVSFYTDTIFSLLCTHRNSLVSVKDALDDLRSKSIPESEYVKKLNRLYHQECRHKKNKWANHEERKNNNKVRARFRLYQVMNRLPTSSAKEVTAYLKDVGTEGLSHSTLELLKRNWLLDMNGTKILRPTNTDMQILLSGVKTKKQTQKALVAELPAPAALSIPDDACHYHESVEMQRTLTVREMARIQSFPDWFEVRSKVTTGGQMRRFEVPQYTQIGNAVPPILGLALGNLCKELLKLSQ